MEGSIELHEGLAWLRAFGEGRDWLARLPGLVDACAEDWSLTLGEPFAYAFASLALPATREDGSAAVLKIQFPDRESEYEAAALDLMDGDGAVRLLAHVAGRRALLLERADPRTPLKELDADQARTLLDAALEAIGTLSGSQGEQVLVHQDMHADNVIRAQREPWLLIDPKPLSGEREFGIAAIVRGRELGHSREAVVHRLDRLTSELHLDRERSRRWALAQTIAWAFDGDDADPAHVEIARWLWEAG